MPNTSRMCVPGQLTIEVCPVLSSISTPSSLASRWLKHVFHLDGEKSAVCAALPPPCVRALRARVRHLTSVRSPLNRMVDERIMPLDGLAGHVRLAVAEAPDR